jgi:hypothetical protein
VGFNLSGGYYVLTKDDSESSYDLSTLRDFEPESVPLPAGIAKRLRDQGYRDCKPKRKVFAHIVDISDMDWFYNGNPPKSHKDGKAAHFVAPWGEYSRVEKEGRLVMQYPAGSKDNVYRIERFTFKDTYKPEHQNLRLSSTKVFSIRGIGDMEDVSATRAFSGLEGPALRSQDEVKAEFLPLLRNQGKLLHRKPASTTTYIRPAKNGETLVSTIDGKQET